MKFTVETVKRKNRLGLKSADFYLVAVLLIITAGLLAWIQFGVKMQGETVVIKVDGNVVKQINPLDNGWAHCNPQILIDEKESKKHEVVFRMKEGDEAKKFTILGFGVTR